MSRTYREIPDSGYRDRHTIEFEEGKIRLLFASEEKKGINNHTKIVRDKDNHGCTYSKPKRHKKLNERRHRSNVNDMLQKFENENYKNNWHHPDRRVGDELILPLPKEHREYYW